MSGPYPSNRTASGAGDAVRRLTHLIPNPSVSFRPNGGRARETQRRRFGVWIMLADGSSPEQQTFGPFDFFPDWQPA